MYYMYKLDDKLQERMLNYIERTEVTSYIMRTSNGFTLIRVSKENN